MKFEIGDKVSVLTYYKRSTEFSGGETLDEALDKADGEGVEFTKYVKKELPYREYGVVCGKRTIKISGVLEEDDNPYFGGHPKQTSAQYREVYLVATRMNCLRKVEKSWIRVEEQNV